MIGLFFDLVFGKGTYPMIDLFFYSIFGNDWSVLWFNIWEWLVCSLIQYLGMTGLLFDSLFGNDWSVIWFSIWEGYLPHPVGRVLTPPCVGTSAAFQSSIWYCYCPSYRARSSCAEPDLSRHVMAIQRMYCRSPDRTAKCASYKSAQKSASEAESDLHV